MNKTMEQQINDNLTELERLTAIYTKVNDYAKELSGMSLLDLESLIEEAERFDNAFNPANWVDGDEPYDIYYE
jgi:hypothetical protein